MTTLLRFREDHLDAAAALLARRHARDRRASPLLPARFEDPSAARAALEAAWRRPEAGGAVAFEGRRMVGYLIGDLDLDGPVRRAWVRLAGHALHADADPELYRDLYALAAEPWVRLACYEHAVLVPAGDAAARESMFRLGFGYAQAYGLLPLSAPGAVREASDVLPAGPDIRIRRAGPADAETLAGLSPLIVQNAVRSPAFVPIPPEDLADYAEGFAELADDRAWTVWLAERAIDQEPEREEPPEALGYVALKAAAGDTVDDLITPEGCVELKVAATRPEARGIGIGGALTLHALARAGEDGYHSCLADWHVPSLLASRFWPRFGFEPVAFRLARRLDPRIAWADAGVGVKVG